MDLYLQQYRLAHMFLYSYTKTVLFINEICFSSNSRGKKDINIMNIPVKQSETASEWLGSYTELTELTCGTVVFPWTDPQNTCRQDWDQIKWFTFNTADLLGVSRTTISRVHWRNTHQVHFLSAENRKLRLKLTQAHQNWTRRLEKDSASKRGRWGQNSVWKRGSIPPCVSSSGWWGL